MGIAQFSNDTTEETPQEKPSSILGSDSLLKGAHNTSHDSEEKLSPASSSDALSEDTNGPFQNHKEMPPPPSSSSELSEVTTCAPLHSHEETPPSPTSSNELPEDTTGSTHWNYEERESPPLGSGETESTRENVIQYLPVGTAALLEENNEDILQQQRGKLAPPPGSCELPQVLNKNQPEPWKMEPFVLFGSSFPKDKEYTQVRVSALLLFIWHLVLVYISLFSLSCPYYSNAQTQNAGLQKY